MEDGEETMLPQDSVAALYYRFHFRTFSDTLNYLYDHDSVFRIQIIGSCSVQPTYEIPKGNHHID